MLTEEGNLISAASIIRATSNGDVDAVRALLADKTDVDQRGRGGHTALMVAAIFGHVDIARLLLDAGANVQLRDNLGLTARDWANRRGSWEVAQLLSNASAAEVEPSYKNAMGKQTQLKVEAKPQNPLPVPTLESEPDGRTDNVGRMRKKVDAQQPEEGVDTSTTSATRSLVEQASTASFADPNSEPDAVRFMKFHKQIMAAQERHKEEQARREANHLASPIETEDLHKLDASSLVHEQITNPERGDKEARPTATQSARIAATIEHLRLLEESRQRDEDEVPTKSNWASQTAFERGPDSDEPDTTLDHVPAETATRPSMLKRRTVKPFRAPASKRCPECNTTYENPLVVYCAFDASKLISADDSVFSASTAWDWSRPTLLALVAIIALVGVSLGYLINNYRSTEKVPSAPIAVASNPPVATQTEQPKITRSDSPLISGTLSGMEVDVPQPVYPANARAEGISGIVKVRVQVNQKGRVILARSSNGDFRLRAAAVEAAQKATFSPEKLAAHERVVSGIITYNFVAQTESPAVSKVPAATDSQSANSSSSANGQPVENAVGDFPVVGGPLVGAESQLPQPGYPETAKSKGIQGTITVVVRVNRAGKVISWRTLEGDSQLRAAALKAAKKATFSPNKLPGKGEVVGTITYNFKS